MTLKKIFLCYIFTIALFSFAEDKISKDYIEKKFQIKIFTSSFTPSNYARTYNTWNFLSEKDSEIISKYLRIILPEFNKYPVDFVKKMTDPSRIYLSGASWGGRLTGKIIHRYPNVFKGGIATCGCQADFWDDEKKEFLPCLNFAQKNTTMALTTGDYDYNRYEAYSMYVYYLARNFKKVFFIQEPGKNHGILSGLNFEKAVGLLEANRN